MTLVDFYSNSGAKTEIKCKFVYFIHLCFHLSLKYSPKSVLNRIKTMTHNITDTPFIYFILVGL